MTRDVPDGARGPAGEGPADRDGGRATVAAVGVLAAALLGAAFLGAATAGVLAAVGPYLAGVSALSLGLFVLARRCR
ncbi:hypothetical protein [Halorussus sp. AFM4]|uniref:hypothetical protein n=1 Tax=Halorussus sp. AFM4 TaxID=3421651 RepID=UPI003EB85309